jgi:hypothetical protein
MTLNCQQFDGVRLSREKKESLFDDYQHDNISVVDKYAPLIKNVCKQDN